jgi:hypothetical protein
MSSPKPNQGAEVIDLDLRPRAVLAVGITGHRNIGADAELTRSARAAVTDLLRRMTRALDEVVAKDANYFSDDKPILRVVTMAADGADLAGAQAARDCSLELACILPFEIAEYLNDFTSASVPLAERIIGTADSRFTLPGTRAEGPRAYERANEVILANVDVLIGIWDGERASGRAGTGDVVQSAVSSGIPVIAIDPSNFSSAQLLVHDDSNEIDRPIATDLRRDSLVTDLTPIVRRIVSPPSGSAMRRGLDDLNSEPIRSFALRFEYPLLLKIFGVSSIKAQRNRRDSVNDLPVMLAPRLHQCLQRIDQLANHYGRLTRSSATSGFLIIIVVAFLSASIGLVFPALSGASIIIQMAVNALVLVDAAVRRRRRWVERWLDYRSVAERLRSLRFLHPLGLGDLRRTASQYSKRQSWTDWYVRRSERALGAPAGVIRESDILSIAKRLASVEIKGQLDYHRHAFRQLGVLERRLSFAAHAALTAAITIAASLVITAYFVGGAQNVQWRPIALVALAVFPAATTAFNGIRADADFVHLVERSAMTVVALSRLRRIITSSSLNYDRVAAAAARAGSLMGDELSEWRFMLENRRLRQARR